MVDLKFILRQNKRIQEEKTYRSNFWRDSSEICEKKSLWGPIEPPSLGNLSVKIYKLQAGKLT